VKCDVLRDSVNQEVKKDEAIQDVPK